MKPRLTNLMTVEVWSFIKRFTTASTNFEGSSVKIAENRIENKSRRGNFCDHYFTLDFVVLALKIIWLALNPSKKLF